MISFLICIALLILGYAVYGRFVEKVFRIDTSRTTPAYLKQDGVDYVPMPTWKTFMVQFLNIAGTGPIFGAIMGAKFGPSSYLWIVFGCIFAGAVYDYLFGMLSIRHGGAGLPDIVGTYLGKTVRGVMLVFALILLLLVGVVFVYSPAEILANLTGDGGFSSKILWVGGILLYFIIATLLPIDKLIGRIYPLFAFALLFMTVSLMVCLIAKWPSIPEVWNGLGNLGAEKGLKGLDDQPIFPCLFITIACGAISGFHATQSPLMARCIKNEKYGRPIFYGSMITEGIVALVWAAVSSYFFFDGGAAAVGSDVSASAPVVVTAVSKSWLGLFGGILAVLGVVAAPITSGDTAFRSARLIVSDALHLKQSKPVQRLYIAIPIFCVAGVLLWFNIANEQGFNIIWRYFGWSNQTLACFALWAVTVYLANANKGYSWIITFIPACFLNAVSVSYIAIAKIGFNLPASWSPWIGLVTFVLSAVTYLTIRHCKDRR